MITIKPADQKTIEQWYGGRPQYSMRGIVALEDNIVIGIGGLLLHNGKQYMFCEMKECARKHRKYILKAAKALLKLANGRIVYAIADKNIESASRFLEHLGFILVNDKQNLYMRGK